MFGFAAIGEISKRGELLSEREGRLAFPLGDSGLGVESVTAAANGLFYRTPKEFPLLTIPLRLFLGGPNARG